MSTIAAVVITLCSIFPTWVVTIALALITIVAIVVIIKIVGLVLDAIPFV